MELIFEEPPCQLDDVIRFSYSFENLHKFLNFLVLNSKESFTKLHDVKIKLREIDDLKSNLDDVTIRVFKCEGRFSEIENTVNSFFKKFNDLDSKIVTAVHKLNIYSEDIKTFQTKLAAQDENLNNLNRLTEENIKTIFKQGEVLEKLRNTNEILLDKTDKSDKAILKLNNEILRFNDVEKSIRENTSKIEDNTKSISDFQYYSNSKFSDLDSRMMTIFDSLSEMNRQMEKKGTGGVNINSIGNIGQSSSEGSNSQIITEMAKSNKEIDNLKKLFREFSEKVDKISKTNLSLEEQIKEVLKSDKLLQKKISILNVNGNNNNNKDDNSNSGSKGKEGVEGANNEKHLLDEAHLFASDLQADNDSIKHSIDLLFERMKKFQEMFKSVTANLGQKTEKNEFEKLSKNVTIEIEKLNKRISEASQSTNQKLKAMQPTKHSLDESYEEQDGDNQTQNPMRNAQNSSTKRQNSQNKDLKGCGALKASLSNGSGFEFDEGIISMTRRLIERELSSKEEFSKMLEFMEEQKSLSESSKGEIDKLFSSVVEIRSSLSASALSAQKLEELQDRLSEIDFALKKQKNVFEERLKGLEGVETLADEGEPSNNAEHVGGSIKDNIKGLNGSVKSIGDKIEKVTMRLDNMNNEILGKVKKDLSAESAKILLEFKGDLKNSIMSIEEQLREKVDKFSLDEFGKYVNEKLSQEMNKKLDRTDLKKNNSMINKKIDTLENKISKTLVDTLIDLQMEEAPLIVKKPLGSGAANEKCASCNQFVLNTTFINEDNLNDAMVKTHNTTINPAKIKFKNVQESCYKFGAGSYSRYLSSIDNVNEDLRLTKQNIHLPEISSNKTGGKKFNFVVTNNVSSEAKLKNKILEEIAEKNYLNTMLNEELEKKVINPESLIKTANKLYESVEKEKRIIISNNFNNK